MAFSKYLVEVLLLDGCPMGSGDLRDVVVEVANYDFAHAEQII
jgi:hypothetical protein